MAFAERVAQLAPEGAYHMLARAQALEAQGRQIIHLEIGQPDGPTFANIVDAGVTALRQGRTRYTPSAGIRPLRQAIAEQASSQRGIPIEPAQVVVGPGAKPALFFPTLALVQPGDEVIYPDPGFPTYEAMIHVAGGVPVAVPLLEENDFSFDLDAFDAALSDRTRLVVLNSPGNPTGGVMSLAALEHIAEAAQRRDFWVLSDEIYTRLSFEGQAVPSIASAARHGRAHGHLRRLLEDLRHDRLAARLRHHAPGAGRARRSAADPLGGLHGGLHAVGRRGGAHRAAGSGGGGGRGVQTAPRCAGRRAQRHPRHPLPVAAGGVLRLPERDGFREVLDLAGGLSAGKRRGGAAAGHGLRQVRRGLSAALLCEFARQHPGRAGADGRGAGEAVAA